VSLSITFEPGGRFYGNQCGDHGTEGDFEEIPFNPVVSSKMADVHTSEVDIKLRQST
jgi:hypothetical protein